MIRKKKKQIKSFDFKPGRIVARKYEVISKLGTGWEGEVYLLREMATGIERAGKVFYPHRNRFNRAFKFYAKKLHKLRHCPIIIQYHTQETMTVRGIPIAVLISEFVEGELLEEFIQRQPGKRLPVFPGLHLLHSLASGIEKIHQLREYHGDLHSENIIVQRHGLSFDLKLVDLFQWQAPRPENIKDDVCFMIRVFYDAIGGAKHYAKHPQVVKDICCGLKSSLIIKKFRTAGQLREYLETMRWKN
jgi:tRNA A-37 threonylcarbamoyl transferase component Bud32